MKYRLRGASDIELGKDGSKWKHDYVPLNAAAVALKAHKHPGAAGGGKLERTPGTTHDTYKLPSGHTISVERKTGRVSGEFKRNAAGKDALDAHPEMFESKRVGASATHDDHNVFKPHDTEAVKSEDAQRAAAKQANWTDPQGKAWMDQNRPGHTYRPGSVTANDVTGSVGNMTDVSALRAAHAAKIEKAAVEHQAREAARGGLKINGKKATFTRIINGEPKEFDVSQAHADFQKMNVEHVRRIAGGTMRYRGQLVDSHIRSTAAHAYKARTGKHFSDPFGNASR